MVVGVVKGQVTRPVLIQRLGLEPDTQMLMKDLLVQACSRNLVTKVEFDLSVPKKESVLKCYMYSVITDVKQRDKIEKYVLAASQLYTRGSIIANLLALKTFGPIEHLDVFPKFAGNLGVTKPWYEWMQKRNSTMTQIFCPERWVLQMPEKAKRWKINLREPRIQEILNENEAVLNNLKPDWESVMCSTGWDNSFNRMFTKYRANIQVALTNHLPRNLEKYLGKVEMADDTFRSVLKILLQRPVRPMICHNDDFRHIMELRKIINYGLSEYIPSEIEFTDSVFDLAIGLKKIGVDEGTYLPLSNIGRKYCYIDLKIAKSLFKREVKEQTFAQFFKLTKNDLKARKSKLRRDMRKTERKRKKDHKNKAKEGKKRAKFKERWKNLGIGSIKDGVEISSFETDGVGISICLKKPINIFAPKTDRKAKLPAMKDEPVIIGVDTGRAKAFTAAISTKGYKKPVHQMLTRRTYYFQMKNKIRARWEASREVPLHVNPLLAQHPKSTQFVQYLQVINDNLNDMRNEYLINKERALWRMRLYRLKMRSLDRAVQKVFDAAKSRPIVFGIGEANFAATGRGEQAMPTTQLMRAFKKGEQRYIHRKGGMLKNYVRFEMIDEYMTTQKCSRSGEQTTVPMTGNNVLSRRLRFSAYCQQQNGRGLRDRDIQAAENMLWCTQAVYYGFKRPSYLTRPRR